MSFTDFDFPHTNMYDSDLRELIYKVKTLWDKVKDLDDWKEEHQAEYDELKEFMDAIVSGNFPPGFEQTLREWLDKYAIDIIGSSIKHIYFGLNDNGHLIVTIPENWRDLVFKTTGYDYNTPLEPEFGHLCLLY